MRQFTFPEAVPHLTGGSILLREMLEEDVPQWFERASDAESSALSGDPIPDSVDVCHAWLEDHLQLFRKQRGIRWAIVPRQTGTSIGSIGLSNICRDDRSAELGAVIARACWNRGIVTSAARLVLEYAFGGLGLVEIRADLVATNHASKRVLEKLGFRLDHIIEHYRSAGPPSTAPDAQDRLLYILHHRM